MSLHYSPYTSETPDSHNTPFSQFAPFSPMQQQTGIPRPVAPQRSVSHYPPIPMPFAGTHQTPQTGISRPIAYQNSVHIGSAPELLHVMRHLNSLRQIISGKVYSPLSTYLALSMLLFGSGGKAKEELSRFLGLSEFQPVSITSRNVLIANGLFIRPSFPVRKEYINTLQTLNTEVYNKLDADLINGWVSQKTQGLIPKIVDGLTPNDVLILINTIYFKSQWMYKFSSNSNYQEIFNKSNQVPHVLASNPQKRITMMKQTHEFNYFEGPNYQKLEMPYTDGATVMGFILPRPDLELEQLDLSECLQQPAYQTEVIVHIPKFTQESTHQLDSIMKYIGVRNIFSTDCDNLHGISNAGKSAPFYVSKIIQKAKIIVDEEGTEAAAATMVQCQFLCADLNKPPTPLFKADRNFIYYIRSGSTFLFIGSLTKA